MEHDRPCLEQGEIDRFLACPRENRQKCPNDIRFAFCGQGELISFSPSNAAAPPATLHWTGAARPSILFVWPLEKCECPARRSGRGSRGGIGSIPVLPAGSGPDESVAVAVLVIEEVG